jgi:hypothetical protein
MKNDLERLIALLYRKWKSGSGTLPGSHPDEEALACFTEHMLDPKESEQIKRHIVECRECAAYVIMHYRLSDAKEEEVPPELIEFAQQLSSRKKSVPALDIVLVLKDKAIEIIRTSGDVLVGQELVPALVLRSRKISDFKDEVCILKDFQNIRVEVRIERKHTAAFGFSIVMKNKTTQEMLKDTRVTLIKNGIELESYFTDTGKVYFEHVLPGHYTVEVVIDQEIAASIQLDIT